VAASRPPGVGDRVRTWVAPSGAALLLSVGFRPGYLAADRLWRLAAGGFAGHGRRRRGVAGWRSAGCASSGRTTSSRRWPREAAQRMLRREWLRDWIRDWRASPTPQGRRSAGRNRGRRQRRCAGNRRYRHQRRLAVRPVPGRASRFDDQPHEVSGGRPIDAEQLLDAFWCASSRECWRSRRPLRRRRLATIAR